MRTLVVSDLHLGGRLGHDVLSRPEPVTRLLQALRARCLDAERPAGPVSPPAGVVDLMALGLQMRRASIPAMARVVHRLGVDADYVVFGHVHRRGPVDNERLALWHGPGGRPRMVNTGSWVYEPLLVHHARGPHPYWPGGAVILEPGAPPRSVGLLDGLGAESWR